jgi:hypothetical protein
VEERFQSRQRECRERFVVTSCVDDAKGERRQALDRLRARQLVVDEARRQERAAERRLELADKAAEDARRDSAREARAAASGASAAPAPSGRPFERPRPQAARAAADAASGTHDHRSTAPTIGAKPRPPQSQATRRQLEAAHRAAYEARQAEALAHREETIDRTTRRMAQKSPASSLPVPPAASGAGPRDATRR